MERCPSRRRGAETQIVVPSIIGSRPDEWLPDGFAQRLSARLDCEGPLPQRQPVDWRRLTIRWLPAAAALALLAVCAPRLSRPSTDLPKAVASWGRTEVRDANLPLTTDTSSDVLFGTLLLAADGAANGDDR
jgi:hypothetical protein